MLIPIQLSALLEIFCWNGNDLIRSHTDMTISCINERKLKIFFDIKFDFIVTVPKNYIQKRIRSWKKKYIVDIMDSRR